MSDPTADVWLRCSACRKEIAYGQVHWVCSVSTCNRSRTRLVFCSVACWDSHLATLHHREAWAVEERAPTRETHARDQADGDELRSWAGPPPVRPATLPVVPPQSRTL